MINYLNLKENDHLIYYLFDKENDPLTYCIGKVFFTNKSKLPMFKFEFGTFSGSGIWRIETFRKYEKISSNEYFLYKLKN